MSGMAEVLAGHTRMSLDGFRGARCECGRWFDTDAEYVTHVTEALTAAGFGDVREAKAEAWDEGSGSTVRAVRSGSDYPVNPYRAAAVRGEG